MSSVTVTEAEYDDNERDLQIAWAAYSKDIGPHGQPMSEATFPGADPTEYGTNYSYAARGPFTDWAEKARLDAIDAYRAQFTGDQKPNTNGHFWIVDKNIWPQPPAPTA